LANKKKKQVEGTLPCRTWLAKTGREGLDACMKKYPEKFAHIKQNFRGGMTSEEWVAVAEKLAKNNNGVLPSYCRIEESSSSALNGCIQRYPEKFTHLKQDKVLKTIEENVKQAEYLAKNNNGVLYNYTWLRKNGHNSINRCVQKYPENFKHIKQEKILKNVEHWVKKAEQLSKKHNNILPYPYWLRRNGHEAMMDMICNYPKKFSHIKQESRKGSSPDEWVIVAKRLAEENGGILPSLAWLKNNGYYGLKQSLPKHTELFRGIKQHYFVGRTKGVRIIGE